jgi:hypothetical protein
MDTDITDKMESETYILQHGHFQIEVGQSRQGPAQGGADRRRLAESEGRPLLSRAGVCDLAVTDQTSESLYKSKSKPPNRFRVRK